MKYKENSSELSKLVDELNITRSSLKDQFNKITNENNNIINNRCPLCGYGWENYNKLIKQIEKKKKKFIVFCDETMKKVQKEIEELYSNHLEGLISSIDNYLDKEENKINNNFYKQLSSSYNRVDKVKSLIKFCKNQRINLTKHINKKINRTIGNIDEEVEKLKEEIRKRHKIVNEEYYYKRNEDNFDYLYKELFNEKEKNVSNLNIKLIKQKKSYIDYLYYNNVIQEIKNMEENKEKLESKLEKIEDKLKSLKSSIKIYNTCIKEHWGKIIKKVEIPFYIYSGKIIQDYQRGIGIFIKGSEDKEELDSIKFVPNLKTDHDVINYLSSGQLSGLVIAFTLALNKVYGNRKLTTVLIDDPVQTMDDINMACFVEVLRNEFSNKQIIMSTHEDNVSMYMRYKFAKYNLKQVRFNVKERLNDVLG
ncbi:hypothetical protein [Halonatronum saccharophilum]|uniref:hypothetical protein n=1 Tax=Halonatronum saccharophilum TaxID=150060 RepID=UPI0004804CCF|nr:hypothetical protein [Halonatronum saccharophilum]